MKAPICECGVPGVKEDGARRLRAEYWICGNPACRGYGQVLRCIEHDWDWSGDESRCFRCGQPRPTERTTR